MSDKLVLVEWRDSHISLPTWRGQDDIDPDPDLIRTVGFELRRGEVWLTLCQSKWASEDGDVQGVFHIPVACIERVTYLASTP